MPMDHKLVCHMHQTFSLIHMAHLSGNTSGVSNLLTYTGFPGDVCLTFFNILPGNKDAVMPKPPWKKRDVMFTTVTTSAYQHQLNAGFSKVCEIFKVCDIESLKYIREFYTPVCYCGEISTPWNVMRKRTVIGFLTCRSNGLMGGAWPMKAAMDSRPSAVILNVWLCKNIKLLVNSSKQLQWITYIIIIFL